MFQRKELPPERLSHSVVEYGTVLESYQESIKQNEGSLQTVSIAVAAGCPVCSHWWGVLGSSVNRRSQIFTK